MLAELHRHADRVNEGRARAHGWLFDDIAAIVAQTVERIQVGQRYRAEERILNLIRANEALTPATDWPLRTGRSFRYAPLLFSTLGFGLTSATGCGFMPRATNSSPETDAERAPSRPIRGSLRLVSTGARQEGRNAFA